MATALKKTVTRAKSTVSSTNEAKTSNIIDVILADREKNKEEVEDQADLNKILIDDKTFFTDNLRKGILSKEQFLEMIGTASEAQLNAIKALAKAMSEKRKLNTSEFSFTDKMGQEYYFIKVFGQNGSTEFKILTFPGLEGLIQGYVKGDYSLKISLEGLYQEATTV